jgi:acyl-CoA thioester hydrolase
MSDGNAVHAEGRVRVRYAETDQMGVVYHSNYLVWFEVGRVEILRSLGLSYKQFEAEGFMIAVVEASCRYKSPARYDDEIAIRTRVSSFRGSLIRFAYRVVRVEDETLLAEGETVHLVVDKDMKRAMMPESYAAHFRELAG